MMKKRVLTSVVLSTVLASVFVFSGCDGSEDGSCCGGLKGGADAKGNIPAIIIADDKKHTITLSGNTGDGSGSAGTGVLTRTYDGAGNENCKTEQEQCSLTIDLSATTCTDRVEADDRYHVNYGNDVLDYVWENKDKYQYDGKDYDPTKQMVVYGGAMLLNASGFSMSDLKVDVKGMECGKAILHNGADTVQSGFANPGHNVFALIKIEGQPDQWTTVTDIMDESGNFTIDLDGINLGDGSKDVEVLLFSIKDGEVPGSTGMSGANS